MSKTTKQDMVLEEVKAVERITSADIKSNFGVANLGENIQELKFAGYEIFLNKIGRKGSK